MKIHTSKFEEVLAELEKANHGWGLLGHNLSASRVGLYEREMRKLIEMGPNGRGNLTNEESGRVYLLLSEISEFLFASNVALARPHLAQATRIRDIFSGPDLASSELLSPSVVSRNTLFELTFAAAVEMAGMTVDLSGVTDVKTEFQGVPISIECKRPQTMGKVESNIRRAAKQLAERNTNDTFGLVAICIGKILTGGEKMLVATDKQSMTERLDGEAMDFLKNTMRFWSKKPAVAGMLVRINLPGIDKSTNNYYHVSRYLATNRPDLPTAQRRMLTDFVGSLDAGLPGSPFI